MIGYLQILVLSIAVSIDSLSVGIVYGMRKIDLNFLSLIVISGITTLAIYITGYLGTGLTDILGANIAEKLGNYILIAVGIWISFSAYLKINGKVKIDKKELFVLNIKPMGIIIKILKEPGEADLDKSGNINLIEAIVLGGALAFDAIGAGLGAGLAGFSNNFLPLTIGCVTLTFIVCGVIIGKNLGEILPEHFELFPGFILIIFGVLRLFIKL